jgi:hypothetical protein
MRPLLPWKLVLDTMEFVPKVQQYVEAVLVRSSLLDSDLLLELVAAATSAGPFLDVRYAARKASFDDPLRITITWHRNRSSMPQLYSIIESTPSHIKDDGSPKNEQLLRRVWLRINAGMPSDIYEDIACRTSCTQQSKG